MKEVGKIFHTKIFELCTKNKILKWQKLCEKEWLNVFGGMQSVGKDSAIEYFLFMNLKIKGWHQGSLNMFIYKT